MRVSLPTDWPMMERLVVVVIVDIVVIDVREEGILASEWAAEVSGLAEVDMANVLSVSVELLIPTVDNVLEAVVRVTVVVELATVSAPGIALAISATPEPVARVPVDDADVTVVPMLVNKSGENDVEVTLDVVVDELDVDVVLVDDVLVTVVVLVFVDVDVLLVVELDVVLVEVVLVDVDVVDVEVVAVVVVELDVELVDVVAVEVNVVLVDVVLVEVVVVVVVVGGKTLLIKRYGSVAGSPPAGTKKRDAVPLTVKRNDMISPFRAKPPEGIASRRAAVTSNIAVLGPARCLPDKYCAKLILELPPTPWSQHCSTPAFVAGFQVWRHLL